MPLYKRPGSPFWWVRLGRKTRRSTGTADKKQAREFEERLKERLWRRDKLGDRGSLSFHEVAERYLKGAKRPRKRDRALIAWLETEGELREESISSVAHPDALEMLQATALHYGWSHSTTDRMMRTVRAVLRYAKRMRLLDEVPHIPMFGEPESKPRFLTRAQFAALCAELPPHLALAARFAVCTLLRLKSQALLTWDRVNVGAATAWIPPEHMKGGARVYPDGFTCTLSSEALRILEEARRLIPGERVFGQDNLHTAAFGKAAARAGVAELRWHDLRHTGASWAVQGGVSLPLLMELGGWKSYRMVLVYARFAKANAAVAAEVVAQSVAQAVPGTGGKKS